ncbi:helix-turn-helix domain-containing protein [Actinoplanes sp. NEAU-A12]|uniref:Helix-turn-helix domain-containing protein n=1 Tax=Actinoplanes sandaracinus TaxID=3045177 RepID=A0ABT6WJA8_9ACTN|nr:helix-turn-helix domain-containing protein [Actinoplanes sandaracinus]MDI6099802.1 helix-turn-helix domain-containing protein [Actinoplanes sandaracinus]
MTTSYEASARMADMRAEARRLRVDPGLSRSQLIKLFGVSNGTLTDWLRGIEPPQWTRRPNAKDDLRREAADLREKGWSINDIATRMGVAKSTAFNWVGHVPLDPDSERAREKRELAKQRIAARWDGFREERDRQQMAIWEMAARDAGRLSDRDVLLLGAISYWCEGAKSKPWARADRFAFINSDPGLLALIMRFLQLSGYDPGELAYRVSIHETADAEAAADWWAETLSIPRARFQRPTIKKHVPETPRQNVGDDYHGCLTVTAPKSRELYWRMEGVVKAVIREASSAYRDRLEGR